jgi:hypothetical protein
MADLKETVCSAAPSALVMHARRASEQREPQGDKEAPMQTAQRCLTPREAEQVVQDRIERFGLGALPDVSVVAQADGSWRVRWDEFERTVSPMTEDAWYAWLEAHVGPLSAEQLQTTEC